MASGFLPSFLGALQASLSVLLTITYGVSGAQFKLISKNAAENVSALCVKMFLPALLFTNIGSQLDVDSGNRYVPVLVWGILYNILSIALGLALKKILKLPSWVTPAITFNNTTAMPLLLFQSLKKTGLLDGLLWGSNDNSSAALERANSYFLVNSMIVDMLIFGLGPKLIHADGEDEDCEEVQRSASNEPPVTYGTTGPGNMHGEEAAADYNQQIDEEDQDDEEERAIQENEQESLLPRKVVRVGTQAAFEGQRAGSKHFQKLPALLRKTLDFIVDFVSLPFVGAVSGAIVGLAPPLKHAFFETGGALTAWFTASLSNIGDIFPALQAFTVGVNLRQSLMKMKKGESSGTVPWIPMIFVIIIRFIVWPAISIPVVWALASKTNLISSDPILWFAMMIMPTGPPALKLTSMADVAGMDAESKMGLSKFLTVCYAVCPLLTFAVVGALKAIGSI